MARANSTTLLSFHKASGNYCKTVKGKRYYLGTDHDEALASWFKCRGSFQLGIDPRKAPISPVDQPGLEMTVIEGVNRFLNARKNEIHYRTWTSLRDEGKRLVDCLGAETPIAVLGPDQFIALREQIDNGNPVTLTNRIGRIRQILNWLTARDYIAQVKYGPDFVRPPKKAMRKHRRAQDSRTLMPSEIRDALNVMGVDYRATALLGINCGFGPTDCVHLPEEVVDLENAIIEWPRVKTETFRRCPLWPETIEALELSARWRNGRNKGRFFKLTHLQLRQCDQISHKFSDALKEVNAARNGASFYSLRHSLATIGREVNDDTAVRIIMGHVDATILDEHYTDTFPLHRLEGITNHVRSWLLGAIAE